MTGLDCLKEEMAARGCTKSQIESKTVLVVLEILANSNGQYSDMDKLEKEIKELGVQVNALQTEIDRLQQRRDELILSFSKIIDEIKSEAKLQYTVMTDYINGFYESLEKCETPEARDALKVAQMFVNSVDVNTKYDNTAFVIGLAAILSQGKVAAIDELHKINKEIPYIEFTSQPGSTYRDGKGYDIRIERPKIKI